MAAPARQSGRPKRREPKRREEDAPETWSPASRPSASRGITTWYHWSCAPRQGRGGRGLKEEGPQRRGGGRAHLVDGRGAAEMPRGVRRGALVELVAPLVVEADPQFQRPRARSRPRAEREVRPTFLQHNPRRVLRVVVEVRARPAVPAPHSETETSAGSGRGRGGAPIGDERDSRCVLGHFGRVKVAGQVPVLRKAVRPYPRPRFIIYRERECVCVTWVQLAPIQPSRRESRKMYSPVPTGCGTHQRRANAQPQTRTW
jgi:hypothetical protein